MSARCCCNIAYNCIGLQHSLDQHEYSGMQSFWSNTYLLLVLRLRGGRCRALPGLRLIRHCISLGHALRVPLTELDWWDRLSRKICGLCLGGAQQQVLSHLCKDCCVWTHTLLCTLHIDIYQSEEAFRMLGPPLLCSSALKGS